MANYVQTPSLVRASAQARRLTHVLNSLGFPLIADRLVCGEDIEAGEPVALGLDDKFYLAKAVPMTPLTSGALTIGKRYVITDFNDGDDFVNVGALNVTGSIFEATGATPTVWANASIIDEADPLYKVVGLAELRGREGQPLSVVEYDPAFEPALTGLLVGDTGIVSNTAGKIARDADKAAGWRVSILFVAWSTTQVNLNITRSDAPKA